MSLATQRISANLQFDTLNVNNVTKILKSTEEGPMILHPSPSAGYDSYLASSSLKMVECESKIVCTVFQDNVFLFFPFLSTTPNVHTGR